MVSKIWPDNIGTSPCYGLESGGFVKNVEIEPPIPDIYVKKAMVSQTCWRADDMRDSRAFKISVGYTADSGDPTFFSAYRNIPTATR
jgi:hypothetical protein